MDIRTPNTELEWEAYFALRFKILREPLGQPLGSEHNDGDKTGEYFALFDEGQLRAIARLDVHSEGVSQVRFVAVDTTLRRKGYGRLIMNATEEVSKTQGNSKMVLQARENAVDFYLKLGYSMIEKSHLLFGQVQHFLMEKKY